MSKTNRIFLHADLDGLMSAALYGKLLFDNGYTKSKFSFELVNYHLTEWQDTNLKEKYPKDTLVCVDFIYHPDLSYWADHHESGLGKYTLEDVKCSYCYNDKAYSCCQVIFESDREKYKDESLIKQIVDQVSMVDYALYPDIDEVYNPKGFGGKFRLALLQESNIDFYSELIRMFIEDRTCFYRLIDSHLPWSVEWRFRKYQSRLDEGYEGFKKVCKIKNGVTFFTTPSYIIFDRYFCFRLHPKSLYTVYIRDFRWNGHDFHIGVSKNPWEVQDSKVNIREICEKYGGGGHEAVGGVVAKTEEEAYRIQNEIVNILGEIK